MTKFYDKTADKTVFLPGATSYGHYQIELACEACHTGPYTDRDMLQKACVNCHGEALKEAKDKHPESKFTDPRNADRLALLDARYCVTCHVEHRPEITLDMGVTMPADYCHLCHYDIARDRPSHAGMAFDTCASAGCHNFHDDRALYEDFLVKHAHEPDTKEKGAVPALNFKDIAAFIEGYPADRYPLRPLKGEDADAPPDHQGDAKLLQDWLVSKHAAGGVNCSACHEKQTDKESLWLDKPDHEVCKTCHANEVKHFLAGRHGMRLDRKNLKRELSPMTPALARLPMKEQARDKALTCNTCHGAHNYATADIAVDSCLGCHDDEHSLAYKDSPHYRLWQQEKSGALPPGRGVSCATCHMPRIEVDYNWGEYTHIMAEHNQSDTMRPNEKMIRPVCMTCHGLGFSIDALADEDLIRRNFNGRPAVHIRSIDMAEARAARGKKK